MASAEHRIKGAPCERAECHNLVRQLPVRGAPVRYCSAGCRKHAYRRPDMNDRPCGWCGETFSPSRPDNAYCSPRCQKAIECERRKVRRSSEGERPDVLEAKRLRRRAARSEPAYVLRERLRNAIKKAVRRSASRSRWSKSAVLSFTDAELVAHFEAMFEPGMSWENFGEWHVDHVRPLASFDATESSMREANQLKNLRPMWAAENIAKGSLYQGQRHRYAA